MKHRNDFSPPQFPYPWASDWGEDQYGLWQVFTYKGVRQAMRWIAPGHFMMGSPADEAGRDDDEDLHPVTLTQGFWLAETTVTQALWQAVMSENPSEFKGDNLPVERVSWDDVQLFIAQLKLVHPDLQFRLPWEAEWEYACRAGDKTQRPFNFAGELTLAKVNYRGTWNYEEKYTEGALQQMAEVATYPCNAWGLFEMHGNVWEWCQDHWQENLGREAVIDPWQQQASSSVLNRVLRGGSWDSIGRDVRSALRSRSSPDNRYDDIGFRLALGHSGSGQ